MSYQLEYSFYSYTSSLNAKLYDSVGEQVGTTITTGFVSLGSNQYSYLATIPDGHIGTLSVYDSANPTAAMVWAVNPQEAENVGAIVASVAALPSASSIATTILDTAITEPTSVFSWSSATVRKILQWLAVLNRNKMTQTATTQTVRNNADNASIATSATSSDGTTTVRDSFQ